MKEEKFKELVKSLRSEQEKIALKAVADVRRIGDVELLPILARLLSSSKFPQVMANIKKVFIDLKDPRTAETITEIIINPEFEVHRSFLVSTCWQSHVDYSAFLSFFTELVTNESFETSMEALTVIEEMKGPFSEDELNASMDRVHEYLEFPTNENEALVESLKDVLYNFESNISEGEQL